MKQQRFTTASWMLVPLLLAAPALLSGLSLWFDWGPQWPFLSIVLAGALLAAVLDLRRALRFGFLGFWVGVITCPLLLLLGEAAWYWFGLWIGSAVVLPALLAPLLIHPVGRLEASRLKPLQNNAEALDRLTAPPHSGPS